MIAPRFRSAVNDDTRPFGTHRFDVFGPKVDRPLTLYGLNAFISGCAWRQTRG